jgi:hypothetical protein
MRTRQEHELRKYEKSTAMTQTQLLLYAVRKFGQGWSGYIFAAKH